MEMIPPPGYHIPAFEETLKTCPLLLSTIEGSTALQVR